MATTQTSSLVKFYIGPVADDTVDSLVEFEALSYTEVGKVLDIGDLKDQSSEVTVDYLNTGRTEVYKGIKRAQNLACVFGYDKDDAGQAAIIAAEDAPHNYAFKIEHNDASEGSPSNNSVQYFRGQVLAQGIGGFKPNQPITFMADISVNSKRYTRDAV